MPRDVILRAQSRGTEIKKEKTKQNQALTTEGKKKLESFFWCFLTLTEVKKICVPFCFCFFSLLIKEKRHKKTTTKQYNIITTVFYFLLCLYQSVCVSVRVSLLTLPEIQIRVCPFCFTANSDVNNRLNSWCALIIDV